MSNDKKKNPILKVKNFGPIGENKDSDDGFFTIEFAPVTVFIGSQASGKSTITKLYSTFAWLEKAFVQGKVSENKVLNIDKFNEFLKYQGFSTYIMPNSQINYRGLAYEFSYVKENIELPETRGANNFSNYYCPKIMYVPSERNLLTVNEKNADKLPELSGAIKTFQERYGLALKETSKDIISLPIENLNARYDKEKRTVFIINKNQIETPISEASSGCQSVVPVVVVSKYLTDKNKIFNFKKSVRGSSVYIRKKVEELASKDEYDIFDGLSKSLDERKFAKEIKSIKKKFSYLFNRCFINIVEEPEQNLFPETQADLLSELLACKNADKHNKLIFSTHSPYLLTSLNNAIYAEEVFEKTKREIPEFPKEKRIAYENVSAYKCENSGIFSIKDDETHLINADAIDDCSIKTSRDFDKLQDLEAEFERNKNGKRKYYAHNLYKSAV